MQSLPLLYSLLLQSLLQLWHHLGHRAVDETLSTMPNNTYYCVKCISKLRHGFAAFGQLHASCHTSVKKHYTILGKVLAHESGFMPGAVSLATSKGQCTAAGPPTAAAGPPKPNGSCWGCAMPYKGWMAPHRRTPWLLTPLMVCHAMMQP